MPEEEAWRAESRRKQEAVRRRALRLRKRASWMSFALAIILWGAATLATGEIVWNLWVLPAAYVGAFASNLLAARLLLSLTKGTTEDEASRSSERR